MILPRLKFEAERDMVSPVQESLSEIPTLKEKGQHSVATEVSVESSIADLVVASWSRPHECPARRPFTLIEAHILASLRSNGPQSAPALSQSLYLTEPGLARSLESLVRLEAISQLDGGRFRLANCLVDWNARITAFELKLDRWPRALEQASAYRTFADAAYVVLDGNRVASKSKVEERAASDGIGVIWQFGFASVMGLEAVEMPTVHPFRVLAHDRMSPRVG